MDLNVHQTLSDLDETAPVARPSTHTFGSLYLKEARTDTLQRRQRQRLKPFRIIVDLYADIRDSADDVAKWRKIAQRCSVELSARGRVERIEVARPSNSVLGEYHEKNEIRQLVALESKDAMTASPKHSLERQRRNELQGG